MKIASSEKRVTVTSNALRRILRSPGNCYYFLMRNQRRRLLLVLATLCLTGASQPSPCPPGMVLIPAGQFHMGRDVTKKPDEAPSHLVKVSSFYFDETLVTNAQFREFVQATHYVTTAEEKGSGMMAMEGMDDWKWKRVEGAQWRFPFGPQQREKIPIQDDYPVVSVSWLDAAAYCHHFEKRLPTEAEWEYAARAGSEGTRFPWGNQAVRSNGRIGLNFWQGDSHHGNARTDGFVYMSPVKAFPPNAWGVYDPVGNVWQWTADWYAPDYYQKVTSPNGIQDPQGPKDGKKKVTRGGSWWCSEKTCDGYGLFFRGKTHPKAVFNNKGFRCAKAS